VRSYSGPPEGTLLKDEFQRFPTTSHSVWGRVIPDTKTLWSTGANRPAPRLYPFLQVSYGKIRESGSYGDAQGQPRYQPRNVSAVHVPSSVLVGEPNSL
jgi:hypothetical protein